jgi:hypothetical protein
MRRAANFLSSLLGLVMAAMVPLMPILRVFVNRCDRGAGVSLAPRRVPESKHVELRQVEEQIAGRAENSFSGNLGSISGRASISFGAGATAIAI